MDCWARFWTAGLLAALAAGDAAAGSFTYSVIDANGPPKIWGKASADMDGDGLTDFLVGGHAAGKPGLYWYRNPTWQRTAISKTAVVGTDIEVLERDATGVKAIVATTDTGGVAGITLFTRGDTAWSATPIVTGFKLHDLEVADLDGDGRPDLVGRGQSSAANKIHVWLQRTAGAWTYSSVSLPVENGDGLRVVDLDEDGDQDIVLPRHWLQNTGTTNALQLTRLTWNAAAPANGIVVVGRIDDDPYLDIAVAPAHRAKTFSRLSWFKGPADPGAGAIWPETIVENNIEADHHFLAIADLDRDGRNDLATAMTELTTNPKIKIFYNLAGDGTFAPPEIVADTSSHSMQVIEVAEDGYLSLLGADYNRTSRTQVKLWRQQPPSAARFWSWPGAAAQRALAALDETTDLAFERVVAWWDPDPAGPPAAWGDGICGAPTDPPPLALVPPPTPGAPLS